MTSFDEYLKMSSRQVSWRLKRLAKPPYDAEYGKDGYDDPSRFWGDRLGLPGLYETYDDVFEEKHAVVQKQMFDLAGPDDAIDAACVPILRAHLSALRASYPDIAAIPIRNTARAWYVVLGCVSKFSPSDVAHFLASGHDRRPLRERLRLLRIQECIGYHLEWSVGPKSLALLEAHLSLEQFPAEAMSP